MPLPKPLPSQEILNSILEYRDGVLFWKKRELSFFKSKHAFDTWNTRQNGKKAGSKTNREYWNIDLFSSKFKLHRVIWVMHFGEIIGDYCIDHINGNKSDNRIENLRLATESQNSHNVKLISTNKSGVKGVHFDKIKNKWRAQIAFENKKITKRFDLLSDAEQWIINRRNELHKSFANSGK